MVTWINGLSCAGKTTIGKALYNAWKPIEPALVFLDGDVLRTAFYQGYGHTLEARKKLGLMYGNLCKMLAEQGINVILCCIGLQEELRKWNYVNIPDYREIIVSAPMDILKQRDKKGLYNGDTTDVMGVDIVPEYPASPFVEILNDGSKTAEEIAISILDRILMKKG